MQKHNLPNTIDSLNGAIGNEIGSGNIRFIQDVGQKVEGVPYLDKNTNKLHLCVTTTNSTDNDSNFIKFDLKESFNKLQNLITIDRKDKTTVYKFQTGEMLIFGKTENVEPNEVTVIFATKFIHTPIVTGTYGGASVNTNVIVVNNKTDSTQVTFNKTGSVGSIGGPVHYIASGVWK